MLGNDSRDDSLAVVETALVSSSQSPDTVSPGRSAEWLLGTDDIVTSDQQCHTTSTSA